MGPSRFILAGAAAALLGVVATASRADVIDFDALPPGSPVGQIGAVSFSAGIPDYALAVVSRFETTSGDRALGVDDGGFEVFFPGDVLTLDFTAPVTSLQISFVSSPNTPANSFTIATAVGSTTSAAAPDGVLADQGEVFHVSVAPGAPFTQAVITAGEGLYSYNLDDVQFVPEPVVATGLPAGCVLLLALHRRRCRQTIERRVP